MSPSALSPLSHPFDTSWFSQCTPGVLPWGDSSPPPAQSVLASVIERTQNVIIAHGALDVIRIANGTLLAIQNMTWGGKLGFQTPPVEPFFVPYHVEPSPATMGASGVLGTAHTERGLTYVGVDLCGHMVPQYQPTAAFRHVEFLLGRVDSLSKPTSFTTDASFGRPVTAAAAAMGNGTV